ncbi:MAG: GNAT family N-acetyltransferase [Candidatus Eremiobacteraeota bacterium]|nr:GNAT family N-acetyltransferase [Candidatus Eremiobacteraeota bacterium]
MTTSQIEVHVRAATRADVPRVIDLASQLGYRLDPAHAEATIETTLDRVLDVATTETGIMGWIAVSRDNSLLGSGDAWIEGLIVDEAHRGRGVGVTLLEAAHEWAREGSCVRMRVRSNVVREDAHRFYEREGYRIFKTQHNFEYRL